MPGRVRWAGCRRLRQPGDGGIPAGVETEITDVERVRRKRDPEVGQSRLAARMDGGFRLIAAALSSDPCRAMASGADLGLDPARTHTDFRAMAAREARLRDGIEAVAIVTPNA